DLKLSENSARAAVASARTRTNVARDALNRAKYLLPNGFIAKSAVDQRQLEMDAAQSALDAAQDQLNQAINASGYAVLLAGTGGIVTSVRAEPGQVVSAGQAVVTLAHNEGLEALVAVPEQEITKLKAGEPASVALWANPKAGAQGKIREIAGAADAASRTYAVRVTIVDPFPEMRLGMTTAVSFQVPQDPAIAVPLSAITEEKGKTIAFTADKNTQTVMRREVVTEGVAADGVRIKSGLQAGDILITGGVQFLEDGMKIRLPQEVLTAVADGTPLASR
ncbi:MAG: efflux RND transporter periplasmic adaptor subunit, partial [Rhodomicrobium sp.]